MQVYLIRHTSPEIEKGICYGQADIEVNSSLFEKELAEIKLSIPNDFDAYYSSPLLRCTTVTSQLSTNFKIDNRLMEMNFGDWELKKWNEINQQDLNPWMEDFVNVKAMNGECYVDLHQRTIDFIDELLAKDYKKVAIITHAGNIRSWISWCLDLPLVNSFRIALNYGAVVQLEINQDKRLNQLVKIL